MWARGPISPSTDLVHLAPDSHGTVRATAANGTRQTVNRPFLKYMLEMQSPKHVSPAWMEKKVWWGDELWQRIVILYRGGNMLP